MDNSVVSDLYIFVVLDQPDYCDSFTGVPKWKDGIVELHRRRIRHRVWAWQWALHDDIWLIDLHFIECRHIIQWIIEVLEKSNGQMQGVRGPAF